MKTGRKTVVGMVVAFALMGVGLIYYARSQRVTLPLSVAFVGLPTDLVVLGEIPKCEALLEGPAGLIGNLQAPLVYDVDLRGADRGRHAVALSPQHVAVAQGIRILEIHPASFFIQIDRLGAKTVAVVPERVNAPSPGFVVTSVATTPETVRLIGHASFLEKIVEVHTTPIDLSGMSESVKRTVALNLPDGISVEPEKESLVQLLIDIQEKIIEQTLSLAVRCEGSNYRFTIDPDHVTLCIKGPQNTLEQISQGNGIHVSVNMKGFAPGRYIRPAVIEPPLDTTICKIEPAEFTVKLYEKR